MPPVRGLKRAICGAETDADLLAGRTPVADQVQVEGGVDR